MSGLLDISTPEKRERFLVVVMMVVLVVVVVPMLYNLFGTEIATKRRQREQHRKEVEKLEAELETEEAVRNKLKGMFEQSLPTDEYSAERAYQNWLISQAEEAKLGNFAVAKSGQASALRKDVKRFTFTLHARGTLVQIADFLRRFEKSGYLHLVRKVDPRTIRGSRDMNVSITIEALSLEQAKSARTLPAIPRGRLNETGDERAMLDLIGERALFSVYTPPRPKDPESKDIDQVIVVDPFDHSPYCYVTGIVEVDGKPQVRVHVRTEDKVYWLGLDEMFRLGGVRCFVRKIDFDRVRFEAAGGFYTVKVGKSFAEYED